MSAPRDYAEFWTVYRPYVISLLITRCGIYPQNAEDIASEIMTRFIERNFLAVFDPTMVFEFNGEARPARFKSFLSKFVETYAKGHRTRQDKMRSRELPILDVVRDDGNLWVDVFAPDLAADTGVLEGMDEDQLVTFLRRHLAKVPKRSANDTCNLVVLFDQVMIQIRRDGRYNISRLRQIFQVSSTAMHTWMWWLRSEIAVALGLPAPTKRTKVDHA